MNNRNIVPAACLVLSLIISNSCAHKEKKEDLGTNASPNASIVSTTPIDSDPGGSDSNHIAGLVSVHFGFDDSKLDLGARQELAKDKDWIASHPNLKIQIEGHCDHRGSVEYNLALGERRAHIVQSYLVELGIPQARLTTISYGDQRPLKSGEMDADFAANRRVNLVPIK